MASPSQILLVEDFKAFRTLLVKILSENPGLKVVYEAEDGRDAIDQARRLKPDLILMDIGLPKLNGLEAARQIRELVPTAKIVFLTQIADSDAVNEAFRLGAWGYILKDQTEAELLPALTAVIGGTRFVGSGLNFDGLT